MFNKFKEVASSTEVVEFHDTRLKKFNRKKKVVIDKTCDYITSHRKELTNIVLVVVSGIVVGKTIVK